MHGTGYIDRDVLRVPRPEPARRRLPYHWLIVYSALVLIPIGALLMLGVLGLRPWQGLSIAAISP